MPSAESADTCVALAAVLGDLQSDVQKCSGKLSHVDVDKMGLIDLNLDHLYS